MQSLQRIKTMRKKLGFFQIWIISHPINFKKKMMDWKTISESSRQLRMQGNLYYRTDTSGNQTKFPPELLTGRQTDADNRYTKLLALRFSSVIFSPVLFSLKHAWIFLLHLLMHSRFSNMNISAACVCMFSHFLNKLWAHWR